MEGLEFTILVERVCFLVTCETLGGQSGKPKLKSRNPTLWSIEGPKPFLQPRGTFLGRMIPNAAPDSTSTSWIIENMFL